jgi:hypothetical protein
LVRRVEPHEIDGKLRFVFQDGETECDWVDLPLKEGERIVDQLIGSEYHLPED